MKATRRAKGRSNREDLSYLTRASKHRWETLRRTGPKIENSTAKILGSPNLNIAITPLGSTLKGYACRSSDIEYAISILSGFIDGNSIAAAPLLDAERNQAIHKAASEILSATGLVTDSFGMDILTQVYNYSSLVQIAGAPLPITNYINRGTLPFYASHLFLPTAYEDARLLTKARRNLCLSFSAENAFARPEARLSWKAIQDECFDSNWKIAFDEISEKPHLRAWFKRHGVKTSSRRSFQAFYEKWHGWKRLPSLAKTLKLYSPRQKYAEKDRSSGSDKKPNVLHTKGGSGRSDLSKLPSWMIS